MIHLGFGLYRHMLTADYYAFAKQCGATHIIIHLVDYFGEKKGKVNQPVGDNKDGWGNAVPDKEIWSTENLTRIKQELAAYDLTLYGIENFNPADWYDILLDGPQKQQQMEFLKQIIRNMGEVGIPVMGYNFSLAGVTGRIEGPFARGKAISVGMDGIMEDPLPKGSVWNMQFQDDPEEGFINTCSHQELWKRAEWFLKELLPVAEESGVKLAAHPDDPPVPELRSTPRLVYQPYLYDRLVDINPSLNNCFEYCLGTITEMAEGDVYEYTQKYAQEKRLAYIHLRNVKGKAPYYHETFIDEGDLDIKKIIRLLKETNYDGVIIPDHTPLMTCEAPWHAGMAFAMGYLKALI